MQVFWRETRRGQRLVLIKDDESYEEEIGGVRETKRGFDAFAKTLGMIQEELKKVCQLWKKLKLLLNHLHHGIYMLTHPI